MSNNLDCLEGGIPGRGCSTKDKVYYKECETNSYGEGTEKFCYCNFYLCNRAHGTIRASTVLFLSVIVITISGMSGIRSAWSHLVCKSKITLFISVYDWRQCKSLPHRKKYKQVKEKLLIRRYIEIKNSMWF